MTRLKYISIVCLVLWPPLMHGQIFTEGFILDSLNQDLTDVALMDFDRDNDLDVFSISDETLYCHENLGNLTFSDPLVVGGSGDEVEALGEALQTQSYRYSYYRFGQFPYWSSSPYPFTTFFFNPRPTQLRSRDIDGDGEPDLLFRTDHQVGDQAWGLTGYWPPELIHQAMYYISDQSDIEVGDFNDDGLPDVVVLDRELHSICIYMGGGDCGFDQTFCDYPEGMPYGASYPHDMVIIDSPIEGINQEIILVGVDYSFLSRMPIESDGTLSDSRPAPIFECKNLGALADGDIDLDGITDVVSLGIDIGGHPGGDDCPEPSEPGTRGMYFFSGGNEFRLTQLFGDFEASNGLLYTYQGALQLGDLDGDGDLDVVLGAKNLQVFENTLLDCNTNETAPQELTKSPSNDQINLKWYKASPQIRYSVTDNAACDIEFWPMKDLSTSENLEHLPHTILDKRTSPGEDLWKWPLEYDRADMYPNTRYKWKVRCHCNAGEGPASPWSETKFFTTPDFDIKTFVDYLENNKSTKLNPEFESIKVNNKELELQITELIWEDYAIDIVDTRGRIIRTEMSSNSTQSRIINLQGIDSGIYILRLRSEGQVLEEKFLLD